MAYSLSRALTLLKLGAGNSNATFRDGQEEAIKQVVGGTGRLLLVQKTGWGKSFVYFIAAKLLREAGYGPTLLISPLLALMRNQIAAARRMGLQAVTINSENADDWPIVETALHQNQTNILLISPERLANQRFRTEVLARIAGKIPLLVVDEAHCISDWGHDFRPHYRLIERIVRTLPLNLRLLATTATANNRVMDDLKQILGPDLTVVRGDLNRPTLALQTIRLPTQAERLAWLAEQVAALEGHGIIYTLTVRDALRVTGWLQSRGLNVETYTSESGEDRERLEQALLDNKMKALVATMALGMGFDKPDLAFVIHYQMPGSVVAYYQQVGRAGRALPQARGILLSGVEETDINDYFIQNAFPKKPEVEAILHTISCSAVGLSVPELMSQLNVSKGRIDKALLLLSLESPAPIVKEGTKWQLTVATLSPDFWQRAERLTLLRQAEQEQMRAYVELTTGHMAYLIKALDGNPSVVMPTLLGSLPATVHSASVQEAVDFLKRSNLPIEPRKKWPDGGGLATYGVKGNISLLLQAQTGKALAVWGDAGWGRLVKAGKYTDNFFADELVGACATLFNQWNPQPAPTWVTCIPSTRHPDLVPHFAHRLAQVLQLPFRSVLVKTDIRPQQKTMANSTQQARNLDGSLGVIEETLSSDPVLLVDDMVDSRWTLTVAAWLLRKNGSGEVWPLVLAQTGND